MGHVYKSREISAEYERKVATGGQRILRATIRRLQLYWQILTERAMCSRRESDFEIVSGHDMEAVD